MQATAINTTRLIPGALVRVTVDKHTVHKFSLVSSMWLGEIRETEPWQKDHASRGLCTSWAVGSVKAIKLEAMPVLAESHSCLNCNIHLETDTSKLFGYCLSCASPLGIPNWTSFSDEMLDELRISLAEPFKRNDLWLQIEITDIEVLEDAPDTSSSNGKPDWDVRFIIDAGNIIVTCPDIERFSPIVKSVPGYRWDSRYNVWKFNATPTTALGLRRAFEGYKRVGTKDFVRLIKKAEGAQGAQAIKTMENLPPIPGVKGGGWKHQRQAFAFVMTVLLGENPYDKGNI